MKKSSFTLLILSTLLMCCYFNFYITPGIRIDSFMINITPGYKFFGGIVDNEVLNTSFLGHIINIFFIISLLGDRGMSTSRKIVFILSFIISIQMVFYNVIFIYYMINSRYTGQIVMSILIPLLINWSYYYKQRDLNFSH